MQDFKWLLTLVRRDRHPAQAMEARLRCRTYRFWLIILEVAISNLVRKERELTIGKEQI